MSEDAMLAYPCSMCEAEPGEPCVDGCPGTEQANEIWDSIYGPGTEMYAEVIGTPPLEESASKLATAVHVLPFGGLVGIRGVGAPLREDYSHDEWLARLADWMTEYQEVLRVQVEDLQNQARQRIMLQFEKDSARAWLGVGV